MTFNKIHKRQAVVLPGASTSTTSSARRPSSTNGSGMTPPSGPPLVITTTSATSTSRTDTVSTPNTSSTVSSVGSVSSASTPATVPTTPPAAATNTATRSSGANTVPRSTTRVTTSATSTASAAPTEDSGMSVGTMAGVAAAAIVGIAVITAFIVWFMRRRNKNRDIDEEPFNRASFMRNSTVIPDDDDVPPPSRIRPQPAMSERGPTPVYGGGPTYSEMGHDGFGYNTQPSYVGQPAPVFNHPYGPGGAPATPLPFSPGYGTAYDQSQGFNNGGYADLTRGAPNHEYPPSPHANSPSYVGQDNFPMPPPAAAGSPKGNVHYPELTPAAASAQQGQVVSVRDSAYNGRETPVQLGFTPVSAPGQGTPGQAQPVKGAAPAHGRPETMYDTEDAYGGI